MTASSPTSTRTSTRAARRLGPSGPESPKSVRLYSEEVAWTERERRGEHEPDLGVRPLAKPRAVRPRQEAEGRNPTAATRRSAKCNIAPTRRRTVERELEHEAGEAAGRRSGERGGGGQGFTLDLRGVSHRRGRGAGCGSPPSVLSRRVRLARAFVCARRRVGRGSGGGTMRGWDRTTLA
eukprot:7264199-Prymnesium_polylepis.1